MAGDGLFKVGLDLLLGLGAALLERAEVALPLEALGGHEALDRGALGVGGARLARDLARNDERPDVVLLVEVEEAADLGRCTSVSPFPPRQQLDHACPERPSKGGVRD